MKYNEAKKDCCCTELIELVERVKLLESQLIFKNNTIVFIENSLENAQKVILKLRRNKRED